MEADKILLMEGLHHSDMKIVKVQLGYKARLIDLKKRQNRVDFEEQDALIDLYAYRKLENRWYYALEYRDFYKHL